jgi:phosphoribosylformylglycinamidine cyclo-ligase
VNRSTWCPKPVFNLVQRRGRIDDAEMESTFNMGIGMLAIVSATDADRALAFLRGRRIEAWQAGEIIEGRGSVQMLGSYAGG